MEYRGYTIEPDYVGYCFWTGDVDCEYDGERWKSNVRGAGSIREAKQLIDDIYFEGREYKVKNEKWTHPIHSFDWLSDALRFIKDFGGELECRYQFDSI